MKKEILEKLQELGFNPEPPILETILEAFPEAIELTLTRYSMRCHYVSERKEDESIVDCAARLLILLNEKGIINFNN
jgi:hypothetical protein